MQVNSVNHQSSFGLKFSPRFKNELRELAIEIFSKDGNKTYGYKYTPKVRDIFEKRVQKLKNMMPDAEIDIADCWTSQDADIVGLSKFIIKDWYDFPRVADIPNLSNPIVLKRKDMPDRIVNIGTYHLTYPMGIHYLIKDLEQIEKAEHAPVMKAAINRMKKLLP